MVSFLKIFQIFVQCTAWFKFAMSMLTPFLFGKNLISNELYQLYWNRISMQIFGIQVCQKYGFLANLVKNFFVKSGDVKDKLFLEFYKGIIFEMILSKFCIISICTCWNILVWVQKSNFFCSVQRSWSVTWVATLSHFLRFYNFLEKQYDKKSQISDNVDH